MSYGTHREVGNVAHREAQYNFALQAGGKGFLIGIASGLAGGYFLQRRYAHVRNLTITMKTFLVASCGTGTGVIFADRAGIQFDQLHYKDRAAQIERQSKSVAEQKWENLSTFDKVLTYTKENKFKAVIGSWFASMAGSWLYIQSQPLSFAQKLVQARVWAQGLTVASLIGMAAITQIPSAGDALVTKSHSMDDQSWEKIIQESERKAQDQKKLRTAEEEQAPAQPGK